VVLMAFSIQKAIKTYKCNRLLAVCCASVQNYIKIHESEFLYLTNSENSPIIEIFCIKRTKDPMQKINKRNRLLEFNPIR
jgi:hypothetical protein